MASLADISEEMRTNAWFCSLSATDQKTLIESSELVKVQPGEYLFRQGDVPNGFFGLKDGRLKASTVREDGKEAILVVIEPGNWFGQTSLAFNMPRMRDIVALAPSQVFAVRPAAFEILMQGAGFAKAITQLQSIHMNWLYRMVEDATLHSTRARIARRLLLLSYGDMSMKHESREEITVSQDTLAMMLGITRQTLALELKAMSAKGAITLRYGRIEILSKEILASFQDYV
jgi:CRP-like cAMP-binding protein